jgi:hypothetical protein
MSGGMKNMPYVTLAGIAAEDSVWADFGDQWRKILNAHPLKPAYIHMREAVPLQREFSMHKGWSNQLVANLVAELLILLSHLDKNRLKMFFCAIDMDAYRKLQNEGLSMDSPVDICNQRCIENVLNWYVVKWPGVIESAHFFFDESEPFREPFEKKWEREKNCKVDPSGKDHFWQIIKTVTTAGNKQDHPPTQAADVLAYAINRDLTSTEDRPYRYHASIMLQTIPGLGGVWNEDRIRREYEKR